MEIDVSSARAAIAAGLRDFFINSFVTMLSPFPYLSGRRLWL
jgi:hypothetical protein